MDKLILAVSPHLRGKTTTTLIMLDVIIALIPTVIASSLIFGIRAALIVAVCVAACVLSEFLFNLICKKPNSLGDLSAVVTGIILAFNLPVSIPLWQAVVGSVFAIVVVKMLFGGIGMNFANPALTARIFMFITFGTAMSQYGRASASAFFNLSLAPADIVASSTPLADSSSYGLMDLFIGNHGGCIGETCALTLLLGGIYLLVRRVISFHIPVAFLGGLFVLCLFVAPDGVNLFTFALSQVLSGGAMLGAIFMATDYVTSPCTKLGKLIFGLGCAVITFLIRNWASSAEGVSFSILIMNILTPHINNLTAIKPLGGIKAK